jgi:hypothetical protein
VRVRAISPRGLRGTKKLPVGPPPEMKIDAQAMVEEFKAAGFVVSRKWEMLPYQYFYEFRGE